MSTQRITNAGEKRLLSRAFKGPITDLRLRLFVNDVTVASDMEAADFTEPAFAEYAAKTLATADWTDPVTNSEDKGDIEHAEQTWSHTGASAEDVYGYWIDDPADGAVLWVHKFSSAVAIEGDGSIAVTPKMLAYDPSDA